MMDGWMDGWMWRMLLDPPCLFYQLLPPSSAPQARDVPAGTDKNEDLLDY
jgi:hypothetical protein